MEMRAHAVEQAAALLGRLAFRLNRAAKLPDPDSVHDLRVAIRRFSLCLQVFRQFFPAAERRKIRRQLRRVMDLAAEVRNRDIAMEMARRAGLQAGTPFLTTLADERKQAQKELVARLVHLENRDFSRKWRRRLGL